MAGNERPVSYVLNKTVTSINKKGKAFKIGTNNIVVSAVGNVGIHTTKPNQHLQVIGNANFLGEVYANKFYGDGSNLTSLPGGGGGSGTVNSGIVEKLAYYPATGTTIDDSNVSYDSRGNVGIGIAAPQAKLHVHMNDTDGNDLGNVCAAKIFTGSSNVFIRGSAIETEGSLYVNKEVVGVNDYIIMGKDNLTYPRLGEEFKITGPGGGGEEQFGWRLDFDAEANYCVIGAMRYDYLGANQAGAAFVYRNTSHETGTHSWDLVQRIDPFFGGADNLFGRAVKITEDAKYIFVATGNPNITIYVRSSNSNGIMWEPFQNISNSSGGLDNMDISSSGQYIVYGIPNFNSNKGLVDIWVRTGNAWTFSQTITNPENDTQAYFGYDLSITSNAKYLTVGAWKKDRIHIYEKCHYNHQFNLIQSIQGPGSSRFGTSVRFNPDGKFLISGAVYSNNDGKAFVYLKTSNTTQNTCWTLCQQIDTPSEFVGGTKALGRTVHLNHDASQLYIGGDYFDTGETNSGSLLIFQRENDYFPYKWKYIQELTAETPISGSLFALSTAMSKNNKYFGVGSPIAGTGYAYIYRFQTNESRFVPQSNTLTICESATDVSGNVGIGLTNPTGLFHIGTNNFFIHKSDGNVGIGTTNPKAHLHIHGNNVSFTNLNTSTETASLVIDSTGKVTKGSVGITKTFIIDHPLHSDKYLVHGCLEGPEAGIYYRGSGCIPENLNYVTISLPEYVSKLISSKDEPIITVSPIYNGLIRELTFSKLSKQGQFTVFGLSGPFHWNVYGKRHDISIEPLKSEVIIKGSGPYQYLE